MAKEESFSRKKRGSSSSKWNMISLTLTVVNFVILFTTFAISSILPYEDVKGDIIFWVGMLLFFVLGIASISTAIVGFVNKEKYKAIGIISIVLTVLLFILLVFVIALGVAVIMSGNSELLY